MTFLIFTLLGLVAGTFGLLTVGYFVSLKFGWLPKAEEPKVDINAVNEALVALVASTITDSLHTTTGMFNYDRIAERSFTGWIKTAGPSLHTPSIRIVLTYMRASNNSTNIIGFPIREQAKTSVTTQERKASYA
jgi:hypothetical protein